MKRREPGSSSDAQCQDKRHKLDHRRFPLNIRKHFSVVKVTRAQVAQ